MNKFLKTALAMLPLAVMASCSDDDPTPDQNEGVAEKSETRYLQVNLRSADANPESRGPGGLEGNGSYESGDPEDQENAVSTLEFYFYDRFKNFHSYKSINIEATNSGVESGVSTEDNVSGFYHCNVPVELIQGETYPQYVICIINSVEGSSYQDHTMKDAQAKTLTSVFGAGTKETDDTEKRRFGMSNSVYYGRDEVTGEDDVLIMATPFKLEALKTESEMETMTQEEKDAIAIDIYVERYAAKVNLDITKTTINDYPAGDGKVTLVFEPTGWLVNAVEKEFYFLKSFRTDPYAPPTNDAPAYGEDYEKFVDLDFLFLGWNNPDHHRCYWARTPNYYENSYPLVADDITDDSQTYTVEYGNYNGAMKFGENQTKATKYVMETTLKKSRLTGEDMGERYLPLASIPSVVLVGKYRIKDRADITDDIDFYAYGKSTVTGTDGKSHSHFNFYVDDDQTYEKTGLDNIIDKMLDDQTILLKKTGENQYIPYTSSNIGETLRGRITIEHPSKEVRMAPITGITGEADVNGAAVAGVKVAADVVVIQLLKGELKAADNIYFYNTVNKGYEQVTASNAYIVNRLLLQNLGGAHFYKDGMAFFSAPIQHWGWYRKEATKPSGTKQNANPNFGKTMDLWDWTAMETGDFGIVRNHVYTLQIGTISGLGTAIKNSTDPIIPPADKVPYVVHFHVNIQKWAVLPTQEWNF